MIKIKKGLDLPIAGVPSQKINNARPVTEVALTGSDYVGMKPTMHVKVGDKVKVGDPIFECKKVPGVLYTSPAAGTVKEINRGDRRVLQTVVISVEGEEQKTLENYKEKEVSEYSSEEVAALMVEAGLWPALRTRPFSKAPAIGSSPSSIFINNMDTNPLAGDPEVVVAEYEEDYKIGVEALAKMAPKLYVIKAKGAKFPEVSGDNIHHEEFTGPHPAGLVGTHIHHLDPVSFAKQVWHIGTQDVVALGRLIKTGQIFLERIVSLAGPRVKNPRLLRTRLGASLGTILEGELAEGSNRIISGSILNGRKVEGAFTYLGRFHNQISVIEENNDREFAGWMGPGYDKFSIKNTYAGKFKNKVFNFHTNTYGSHRAIVPVGVFEAVMPLDILPTQLLKALKTQDVDFAQQLGALELDEEDLALCTFASPGKDDFGPSLRQTLTTIEKEG
ncbi:MAG: NADH:ubiquinone reductase (Na(+)-transporting) subunit A [Halobacteriovoraceae bacterium]|nr:NADH:ubiquinone reductase (Na(+)-transporting) subunit A [Halobacteriovoraceae bacterium]MBC99476.1 NADH:ubiquinone reductase (Na(+)-transporting) subunit A [Halobacteriovoraceae bacterium]|tara:strand:+ start:233443 stop:234780 length:1338 start_codon:yes stop_codon:yes gene_type:complete